jgi:rod shape-determining protein MreC
MAVMTADGIVGKVLLVYPSVAQVLLINDQSSGVGALLEKTRLQGVLRGTANGEVALERVMSDEQVSVGEPVLTSGGDQIFPKGLPVGTVTKVGAGRDLFLNIKIKPAANLSKLEEVVVLVEKQERQSLTEDGVRMRASDILAQRLPSVPDKPATGTNPAGATPGNGAAASQPKTVIKQPAGTATKPPGLAGTAKPATPAKTGVTVSPAPKASKNPAGASAAPITTLPERPTKPEDSASGPQPDASQSNPPGAQPKPVTPSTPPANPQPPADENKPQ